MFLINRRGLLAAAGAALAVPALGQTAATVHVVVPFSAGSSPDLLARAMQPYLQAALGQPVTVDNRPGASGATGTAEVSRAAPDGLTWVLVSDTHAINPSVMPDLGYNNETGLTPVTLLGSAPFLLASQAERPWQRFREMAAAAQSIPGGIVYGTVGQGTLANLAMEMIGRAAGMRLRHRSYETASALQEGARRGDVAAVIATRPVLGPLIQAGTVIPLAQTSPTRSAAMPDIPTLAEAGAPLLDARTFFGVLGPANLPPAIRDGMAQALRRVLASAELRASMLASGLELDNDGEEDFGAFLVTQTVLWGRAIRDINTRPA